MLAGAGDRDGVEQLEEVEVEHLEDAVGGAVLGVELGPLVEDTLRVREHLLDRRGHVQVLGEVLGLALVGELELVLEIVEPVVHRGRREHQYLGLHALADHLAHEPLVARLLLLGVVGVAEVV